MTNRQTMFIIAANQIRMKGALMQIRREFQRYLLLALGILVAVGIYLVLNQSRDETLDAQELVQQATSNTSVDAPADHVQYSESRVYQRVNPNLVEPTDPYHLPVTNIVSDKTIMQKWVRGGDARQYRVITRNAKTNQILTEEIRDKATWVRYNVASGQAFQLDNYDPEVNGNANKTPTTQVDQLKVEREITSEWGQPAWVIARESKSPPAKTNEQMNAQPLQAQKPYFQDLQIAGIRGVWYIDKMSKRLVKMEQIAATPQGQVILQRIENSKPQNIPLSEMPVDWLTPSNRNVPIVKGGQSPSLPLTSPPISLDQALKKTDFQVFLPSQLSGDLSDRQFFFGEQKADVHSRTGAFDIQDASSQGLGLEVLYLPKSAETQRAIQIVQGKADTLVPEMRATLPFWTNSQQHTVTIGSKEISVWVAVGGTLDIPPKGIAAMLEIGGTFIFVTGQNVTQEELLNTVSSLAPAN